ncbi:hypothetical protein HUU53_04535 [Candidatus Micrarchaeota archaeon]|nr:hypothetical protein [Candidatus Micrarchaeota archaeon]
MKLVQLGIGLILGLLIAFTLFNTQPQKQEPIIIQPTIQTTIQATLQESNPVSLKLPAVNKNNEGTLAEVSVEASPGSNKVFIGFSETNPLLNTDTQDSILTALEVAKKYTGAGSNYNYYFTISTDSQTVGGRSAGAAFAVAAIASIQGKTIKPNTLITGTIEKDGRIGSVGRIFEKATALKKTGFKTLLVPRGESKQDLLRQVCTQKQDNTATITECAMQTVTVDVEKETSIQIIEVDNISQAVKLMFE